MPSSFHISEDVPYAQQYPLGQGHNIPLGHKISLWTTK